MGSSSRNNIRGKSKEKVKKATKKTSTAGKSPARTEDHIRKAASLKEEIKALKKELAGCRKAESSHADIPRHWRDTIDAITDPIFMVDLKGNVLRCNRAVADLVGKQFDDIIGKKCWAVIQGASKPDKSCPFKAMRKTLKREHAILDIRGRWFESFVDPLFDGKGKLVGAAHRMTDITERRKTEAALREEKEKAQKYVDIAGVMLCVLDEHGTVTLMNPRGCEILGFESQEIIGKNWFDKFLPERMRGNVKKVFLTLMAGDIEPAEYIENPILKKDGTERLMAFHNTVIKGPDGDIRGVLSSGEDITERKEAEDKIDMIIRQQKAILNNIPDIAWLKDTESRFIAVNEPFGKACGVEPEKLVGKTDLDIWPKDLAKRYRADDREVMTSGKRKAVEEPLADKEGKVAFIETIKTPIYDEDGTVIGTTGIARDITDRKRAEEELRESNAFLENVLSSLDEAVFVVDPKTRTVAECNKAAEVKFGYRRDEMINSDTHFLHVSDEMFEKFGRESLNAYKEKGYFQTEFMMRRKSGEVFPTEHFVRPIYKDGKIDKVVSVVRDITERKKAEEELLRANRALRTLSACNEALVKAENEETLLNDICSNILKHGGFKFAWVGYAEDDKAKTVRPVAQKGLSEGYLDGINITWADNKRGRGPTGTAIRTGKLSICNNIMTDPAFKPWRADARERGYKSSVALPLVSGSETLGALNIYSEETEAFDKHTVDLLMELASDLTYGIFALRTREERMWAEKALRESESQYRNLFDNAHDMIQSIAPDGHFIYVNPSWLNTMGYTRDELKTHTVFDVLHASCHEKCGKLFNDAMSGKAIEYFEATFVSKNGRNIDVEGSSSVNIVDGKVTAMQVILRDVTERKRMEEEIFRSKQDWEYTFDSITDMVTVHDKDYNIILANKAAEEILGLPLFEKTGERKCFKYYHGKDAPPDRCPSCKCLETGESAIFEFFEPHLNKFLEIRAIPRFDINNELIGLIHIVRDITERRKNEEIANERMTLAEFGRDMGVALNKSGTLREIMNACTDVIVDDLDAAFARIWTLSQDSATLELQASSGMYTHIDGAHGRIPMNTNVKIAVIAQERTPHLTNTVVGDPQISDHEWAKREGMAAFAGYPLIIGNQLLGVMAMFSKKPLGEFTLKSLEATAGTVSLGIQRKKTEDALIRSEGMLRAFTDSLPDIAFILDKDGLYVKVFTIPLTQKLVYDKPENLLGKHLHDVLPKEKADLFLSVVHETINNNMAQQIEYDLNLQAGRFWFEGRTEPLLIPGEKEMVVWISRDITSRKEMEGQILKHTEHLEEMVKERTLQFEEAKSLAETASSAKSDFLANMSHELRTPLNAIIGFSEVMQDEISGTLSKDQHENLQYILSSGRHLLSLIDDILDLSKVESGKVALEPETISLTNLLNYSMTMVKERAMKHGIDIDLAVSDEADTFVEVDQRKLKQVLFNLLSNAIKFTPDGGSISMRASITDSKQLGENLKSLPLVSAPLPEEGDYIEISVEDTGIGIKPEDFDKLFKEFSRIEPAYESEYEGTGLGLALTKKLIELCGGTIWVESDLGKGSKFTFVIPFKKASSDEQ